MEKEFIPYELALELKQVGFDEPCWGSYYHAGKKFELGEWLTHGEYTVLAPTYSQAFRFFREKGIVNEIHSDFDKMLGYNRGYIPVVQFIEFYNNGDCYETYEEAELACLKKLIEIANDKQ